MHAAILHRPGYAVVPQLEPGAVRLALAMRGNQRRDRSDSAVPWHDRLHRTA